MVGCRLAMKFLWAYAPQRITEINPMSVDGGTWSSKNSRMLSMSEFMVMQSCC